MKISLFVLTIITLASVRPLWAVEGCASVPMHSETGAYLGCEVVNGTDIQFRDPDSVPENACPKLCESIDEIEKIAEESRALDQAAGLD